jgi:hypothetical protein
MQMCAHLLERGELELLQRILKPFTSANVARSRESNDKLNATKGFTRVSTHTLITLIEHTSAYIATFA